MASNTVVITRIYRKSRKGQTYPKNYALRVNPNSLYIEQASWIVDNNNAEILKTITCKRTDDETIQFELKTKGKIVLGLRGKTGMYCIPDTVKMSFNEFPINYINVVAVPKKKK